MAIGFKSNGQPHTLEEGSFTREEKDNSVIDNQTIPRLMEFRKTLTDSISASVLDSYIELSLCNCQIVLHLQRLLLIQRFRKQS